MFIVPYVTILDDEDERRVADYSLRNIVDKLAGRQHS